VITPGSTWSFQHWFRDGASWDLTNAIEIQFVPPGSIGTGTLLEQGWHSGHPLGDTGGIALIEDSTSWASFYAQHTSNQFPPPPPPAVDFTTQNVIAVYAGWRSSSGYSIAVTDIRLSVSTHEVDTLETQPGSGCAVLWVITQPYQFVTVPKVQGAIVGAWNASQSAYTCP
jgi:hypothetical protein